MESWASSCIDAKFFPIYLNSQLKQHLNLFNNEEKKFNLRFVESSETSDIIWNRFSYKNIVHKSSKFSSNHTGWHVLCPCEKSDGNRFNFMYIHFNFMSWTIIHNKETFETIIHQNHMNKYLLGYIEFAPHRECSPTN